MEKLPFAFISILYETQDESLAQLFNKQVYGAIFSEMISVFLSLIAMGDFNWPLSALMNINNHFTFVFVADKIVLN